jgi:hypothetical protein
MFGAVTQGLYDSIQVIGGYGLWAGGYSGGRVSSIKKYDFVTDAPATYSNTLPATVTGPYGSGNGTTGCIMGGDLQPSSATTNTLVTFSSGAISTGAILGTASQGGETGTTVSYAYYFSGGTSESSQNTNRVQKYSYASNTWLANNSAGLNWTTAVNGFAAHSNVSFCQMLGGYTTTGRTTLVTQVYNWFYAVETGTTASWVLNPALGFTSISGNQANYVTMAGFITGTTTSTAAVYYYTMSTGSIVTATALATAVNSYQGTGDDVRGIHALGTSTFEFIYATLVRNTKTALYASATNSPATVHSMQVN